MSFHSPTFKRYDEKEFENCKVGIIKSSWNNQITDLLYNSSYNFLLESGEKEYYFKGSSRQHGISLYVKLSNF